MIYKILFGISGDLLEVQKKKEEAEVASDISNDNDKIVNRKRKRRRSYDRDSSSDDCNEMPGMKCNNISDYCLAENYFYPNPPSEPIQNLSVTGFGGKI